MKQELVNERAGELISSQFDTPLGLMIAISDEEALYLLEFIERRGLKREIDKLKSKTKSVILPGDADPIASIQKELKAYFAGNLKEFKTPFHLLGSSFQKQAWKALMQVPYGKTKSYKEQAIAINRPQSYRAVANANGANQLAVIVPCHRIISNNGGLSGYGGGIKRKKWLIEHESHFT